MGGPVGFRTISVTLLLVLFGFMTAANFIPKEDRVASSFWPDDGLRLGLDLRGGIHWVVGVELEEAITQELEVVRRGVIESAEQEGVTLANSLVEDDRMTLTLRSEDDRAKVVEVVDDTGLVERVGGDGPVLEFALTESWITEVRERTMLQVLEVLRRRIDDPTRGIPDSIVTRQGDDRVLVQIPGEQIDRDRARTLLKSTGFLEFKIAEDQDVSEEALRRRYPDGIGEDRIILEERDRVSDLVVRAYLLPKVAAITGAYLDDARLGFDQTQAPIVNFTFNPQGGEIFGKLTEANIRKPLAIILDNQVYSAPTINSRITMRGQITGRYTSDEAADLALILRAGSLSVPTTIEEERTVGPGLGQDSIESGARASIIGLALVLFFAAGYYRLSGGYAAVALLANLVMLIGLMSFFEATLTLPGIAGLVLTVGMAVDANVIIFERIREELRGSKSVRAAIATGFQKATGAVLDANITTLITAIILYQYGTGPIKGFAVTLSVGIVTSVFAALVVTRLLFQLYPGERNAESLSI
ncbi:MAG: protein translocase subunit SecD [Myxococcota bacterium]